MTKRTSVLLLAVSAAALVLVVGLMQKEKTYTGVYTFAEEHAGFRADGNDEEWWVSGKQGDLNMAVARRLADGSTIFEGKARVTLRGLVSPKGHYGHCGLWSRQIVVTKVISVVPTN